MTLPFWAQLIALAVLIFLSALFSMVETALLAVNPHRIRYLAQHGNRHAAATLWLLERTDKWLSLILIGSTLTNTLTIVLMTAIAISAFGGHGIVLALTTVMVTFILLIMAEISPKIIGAAYSEGIALYASVLLKPLMTLASPVLWFVQFFVKAFLKILSVHGLDTIRQARLSPEELRLMVLEGGNFIPKKHQSILLNLFDLEKISVEDVMTPRSQIEALNLSMPIAEIRHQLATCYHNKLPVYMDEINQMVGILPVRKVIALLNQSDNLSAKQLRALLSPAYFIPRDTDVLTQLQYFQENHERLGIVVDEYGEVQGLVALEDIIEEMIGEFTTTRPGARQETFDWNMQNECLLEGSIALRDINKNLGLQFPLTGSKTINGLLLEWLQDIPEAGVSVKIAGCVIDIVQIQNQAIKVVKLIKPRSIAS